MKILLTNDDGIFSEGIRSLDAVLSKNHDVTVIAPDRERSNISHSITLSSPLRAQEIDERHIALDGTPVDCVFFGLFNNRFQKPDIVISGINHGENLGIDTYYSGTVAAAREAIFHGIPAIAVSLALKISGGTLSQEALRNAADIFHDILGKLDISGLPKKTLLNINVPAIDKNTIKGVRISHQGRIHYDSVCSARKDLRNRDYYWHGGGYQGFENLPGSDCNDISEGYVTISPVKLDNTDYDFLEKLKTMVF